MKQKEQLQMTTLQRLSNSYKSFNTTQESKEGLLKYCYFDYSSDAEWCKVLLQKTIEDCKDEDYLQYSWFFFKTYVHCIYFVNRTMFNKLRACFMRFLLAQLQLLRVNPDTYLPINDYYQQWCHSVHFDKDEACMNALRSAMTLANKELHGS